MAGTFLGKYDTTAANNTATGTNTVSVAEGMLPSNINNAFRSVMADIRQHYNTAEWIEYGDGAGTYTATYASATSFTIDGVDVTAIYHAGRRVKVVASTPGTIYGTVSSTSFSTNTTVNVTWDSSSLSSEAITSVYIGVLAKTNNSIPTEIIATANIADDAVTTAKIAADAVTGAKIADDSVDSEHYVDGSIDTAHIADSQITVGKMAANSVDSDQYVDGSIDLNHLSASSVNSSKIVDDSIVNADINSSAAISLSKLENLTTARALVSDGSGDISVSDVTATEVGYLDGVSSAIQTQIDAKQDSDADLTAIAALAKTDGNLIVGNGSTWVAESGSTARTSLGLGTIATQDANNVSLTGGSITGLGEPSDNSDASTKSYVDQAVAGLRTRIISEAATTANIDLTADLENGDTLDGVTLVTGDRVLVKDQTDDTENGLYIVVASGTASRDPQFDTIAELSGQMIVVNQGSTNDNKIFLCTTDSDATLESTSITYTQVTPSNSGTVTSITAGTGLSGGTITSAGTIAIDSTVATLTGTQTLTNKTLTSPKINEDVALTSTATELNLLDGVSGLVQSDFTKLAAVDADATELNKLDGLSRGSIIYGNASAVTTVLTKGTVGQVLTSDGTDIAWGDASSGRTGTVDWDTTPKTSTVTAANGVGYFVDTSGGAVTANLPAGSAGAIVSFADYTNTFQTNALTIAPNGSQKIGGVAASQSLSTEGQSVTFVYVDDTEGWKNVQDSTSNVTGNPFIQATGGTITTCGNCKIHTFTGPGTFTVSSVHPCAANNLVSHLVVAGGGGGGSGAGGGGGGGGYREAKSPVTPYTASPKDGYPSAPNRVTVTATAYPIVVGAGGAVNSQGADSTFSTITSAKGGKGSSYCGGVPTMNGGSGGGARSNAGGPAGSGNTPPVSPPQGNPGGTTNPGGSPEQGGGGGGASGSGGNGSPGPSAGGTGTPTSITGSATAYAGGGGGGANPPGSPGPGSPCGTGGSGQPSSGGIPANIGTINTGGAGGGSPLGTGGSGIVVIRYKFQ